MKAFVFVILMIMPDGTYNLDSHLVAKCPDDEKVSIIYNEMVTTGAIREWGGICVKFKTSGAV